MEVGGGGIHVSLRSAAAIHYMFYASQLSLPLYKATQYNTRSHTYHVAHTYTHTHAQMGVTTEVNMILRPFSPLVGKVFCRILGHFRQALSDGLGDRQVAKTCLLQGAGCLDHVVVRGAEVGPVQHLCKALGEYL